MQRAVVFIFISYLLMAQAWAADVDFDSATVKVNNLEFSVEYASTYKQRNQGLMHRNELCGGCGMLFRFDSAKYASMWMKNTYIPLDVAFFKQDGTITDIRQMKPLDLTPIGSSQQVLYALEMNMHWFANNGVKVGDKILVK